MALHGFKHRLRWSDFKVVNKSPDGKYSANTATNISVNWKARVDSNGTWHLTQVSVSLTLNRSRMWVVRGQQTDQLLAHEQVHYDINAIAARTLESRLRSLQGDRSQSAKDAVEAIWNELSGDVTADGRVVTEG